jgi:N-6 DNA Methylase
VVLVPREIASFVHAILGHGKVLSLYSGFGEFLEQFGGGVGVERQSSVAERARFLLDLAGTDARVVNEDPLRWESSEKFERIVCNPPFGTPVGDLAAIEKGLSLLKKEGQLAVIVSPNFLWGTRQAKARDAILQLASVTAVISLPPNVFAHTSIPSSILVLKESQGGKTYMARSKNLTDLDAIAADYRASRRGQKFTLGFEVTLDSGRWDVAYHEPVDFGLGGLTFAHRVVSLGDIAGIRAGKPSQNGKIAINRTGSKVVWVADELKLIPKNNVFIDPGKEVNPSYLHLYLNSSIGRRALAGLVRGAYIPHVSAKELAQFPVVLPELRQQNQIVSDALELGQTVASLQALMIEGEQALKENLFGLNAAKGKFQKFSATTEEARYQQLPFPIAVVQRKIKNAPNNTQKFSLLIELFEVVVRFIALVHLADYINNRKQAVLVAQVPDIKKLFAPTLGDWVGIFKAFARIKTGAESTPFLTEIESFRLDKYQRTLQEFVDIRNASLRGHGATLTEDEYELRFQEHAPKVYDLVSSLGFHANYTLVKTGQMEKDGDFYKIAVHTLMGDNPHFEAGQIVLRTPLDTNKVLYLNRNQESLVLDPYIVLERCPECRRPEVLLFDKFSDKKITYLSYESGHRPALATADRLPPIIREVATRRS